MQQPLTQDRHDRTAEKRTSAVSMLTGHRQHVIGVVVIPALRWSLVNCFRRDNSWPSLRFPSIFGRMRIGASSKILSRGPQFSRGRKLKTRTNWHCFDGKRLLRRLLPALRSSCPGNQDTYTQFMVCNWVGYPLPDSRMHMALPHER